MASDGKERALFMLLEVTTSLLGVILALSEESNRFGRGWLGRVNVGKRTVRNFVQESKLWKLLTVS